MSGKPDTPPWSLLVCRGCCCGTEAKLPGVDHDEHLARLRAAVGAQPGASLRTVGCLGPCERANVVVVRRGQRRWWFGDQLALGRDWPRGFDVPAGWTSGIARYLGESQRRAVRPFAPAGFDTLNHLGARPRR